MIQINHTTQQGFALLLTLVTVSAIITVTLSLIGLTLQQLELSVDARDSERAFHAASAGLECGQYYTNGNFTNISSGSPVPDLNCMNDSNGGMSNIQTVTGGSVRTLTFELEPKIAGEDTCLDVVIYSIDAVNDLIYDVGGQTGEVDCLASSICSVVVARGYDRACSASSGTYEVVRELNAIF